MRARAVRNLSFLLVVLHRASQDRRKKMWICHKFFTTTAKASSTLKHESLIAGVIRKSSSCCCCWNREASHYYCAVGSIGLKPILISTLPRLKSAQSKIENGMFSTNYGEKAFHETNSFRTSVVESTHNNVVNTIVASFQTSIDSMWTCSLFRNECNKFSTTDLSSYWVSKRGQQ